MKILVVGRRFDRVVGGVERMAVTLVNALAARGHDVDLMTWDLAGAETFYPLDSRVSWQRLNMGDPARKAAPGLRLRRLKAMRGYLQRVSPDVIVAFQEGPFLAVAVSALGLGIPVVAAERNAPHRFEHLRAGRYRNLIFQSFRLAARVTVQLESYRDCYPAYLRRRVVAIPNPVNPAQSFALPGDQDANPKVLLSIGRLSYQKNFPVLLKAFAALASEFPDWHLVILGEGEQEASLRALASRLDISDRVELAGACRDVERYYVSSHLFCLPSLWEGFPNALAEALAHGLPAVGFAGCAGVNELIHDGETGRLAPGNGSPESLIGALRHLMADGKARSRFGAAAVSSMCAYSPEGIFDRWDTFLAGVCSTR